MIRKMMFVLLWLAGAGTHVGYSSEATPGNANPDGNSSGSAPGTEAVPESKGGITEDAATKYARVFPEHLSQGFDHQETMPVPGGGLAAAGMICRGHGADVLYVGVKGAAQLADGIHTVAVDQLDSPLRFETGAPDSGIGAGAAQMAFDKSEYALTFEGLDVKITIAGCGSR